MISRTAVSLSVRPSSATRRRYLALLGHEQRSDVRLDHPLHRLEDRGVRLDPENLSALLIEDLRQLIHLAFLP
jgi:hypothetical protein